MLIFSPRQCSRYSKLSILFPLFHLLSPLRKKKIIYIQPHRKFLLRTFILATLIGHLFWPTPSLFIQRSNKNRTSTQKKNDRGCFVSRHSLSHTHFFFLIFLCPAFLVQRKCLPQNTFLMLTGCTDELYDDWV